LRSIFASRAMKAHKQKPRHLESPPFLVLELLAEHAMLFTILWCQSHGNRISGLLGPFFRSMHGAIHVPRGAASKALAGGCASPGDLTAGSPAPVGVRLFLPNQQKHKCQLTTHRADRAARPAGAAAAHTVEIAPRHPAARM